MKSSPPADGRHVYLVKDSNELVSFCKCDEALITAPGQASCPWCGCGWMFSCTQCRKAFTFARGVYTDLAWEDLARRDLENGGLREVFDEDVDEWVGQMKGLLAGIEVGRRYVFLDGTYLPADAGPIQLDGWYARHNLARVPQTAALDNPSIIEELLENDRYWRSHGV